MRAFIVGLVFLVANEAPGQTRLVSDSFFPAEAEFRELRGIRSESSARSPLEIHKRSDARLLAESGFLKLASRTYDLDPSGRLDIELITLQDGKGAYSLLTLLGRSPLQAGPPGDFHSAWDGTLLLARGNVLARIAGDAPAELARRIALSVSNRVGAGERAPILISRFPSLGRDAGTVRYFLGREGLARYAYPEAPAPLGLPSQVEVGQARYSLDGRTGTLTILGFPTVQIAEEYYDALFRSPAAARGGLFYKRTGPLVGVLAGAFDPPAAARILDGLEFTFTVQWIYDRTAQRGRTVWGVPLGVLGTVVRSLIFTALLCVVSLLVGVLFALFRVMLRTYAPGNILDDPERTGMVRLKMSGK